MRYDFGSDNTAGMAPAALEALISANAGHARAYGADDVTARAADLIRARLAGAFAGVPAALATRVAVAECAAGRIVLEASDSLGPLLGWLATLPLDEVQVEPVGLAAVYDRVHR